MPSQEWLYALCLKAVGRQSPERPSIGQGDKRFGSFSYCVGGVFGTPGLCQSNAQVSGRRG